MHIGNPEPAGRTIPWSYDTRHWMALESRHPEADGPTGAAPDVLQRRARQRTMGVTCPCTLELAWRRPTAGFARRLPHSYWRRAPVCWPKATKRTKTRIKGRRHSTEPLRPPPSKPLTRHRRAGSRRLILRRRIPSRAVPLGIRRRIPRRCVPAATSLPRLDTAVPPIIRQRIRSRSVPAAIRRPILNTADPRITHRRTTRRRIALSAVSRRPTIARGRQCRIRSRWAGRR